MKNSKTAVKKAILVVLLVLSAFIIGNESIEATEGIHTATDYEVTYTLTEGKDVQVTYSMTEQNLSEAHSILSRTIVMPAKVSKASAQMNGNTLATEIQPEENQTKVVTYFNRYVFGEGKTINWELSLTLEDEVVISGKLKNFVLKGFIRDESVRSYRAYVEVPRVIGDVNYLSSSEYTKEEGVEKITYVFEEDALSQGAILFSFGQGQFYQFDFRYQVQPGYNIELVIPPDRRNQKIYYTEFTPNPSKTYVDQDGNYRVEFSIPEDGQANTVVISGVAEVNPDIKDEQVYSQESVVQIAEFSEEEIDQYTASTEYWEADDEVIRQKSIDLTEGYGTNYEKAEQIYLFVANHLSYSDNVDLSTRKRLGGKEAYTNPSDAVCQEYSDLFIALARAAGIPAREVAGYAEDVMREESENLVLHSWVEFWDGQRGWVSADPTWKSSANGDYFNNIGSDHFALVVRGADSKKPSIVTTFFEGDDPSDNLKVVPVSEGEEENYEVSIEPEKVDDSNADHALNIANTGNRVLFISGISVDGKPVPSERYENRIVIPNTSQSVEVDFEKPFSLTNSEMNVDIFVELESFSGDKVNEVIEAKIALEGSLLLIGIPAGILALALLIGLTVKWGKK